MEFWIWLFVILGIIVSGQRGIVFAALSSLAAAVMLPSIPALFVAAWLGVSVVLIWG